MVLSLILLFPTRLGGGMQCPNGGRRKDWLVHDQMNALESPFATSTYIINTCIWIAAQQLENRMIGDWCACDLLVHRLDRLYLTAAGKV
ncbi:hypothetical protein F4808DRAFT_144546 [Astrocystis sublimbata]|nr:hypothetical protein F4808DRAFT_144546 [Astrocystis sublimbata]